MINFINWFNQLSEEDQKYRLRHLPKKLLDGKDYTKLYKLLSDYEFITTKINHPLFGVQALIEDYDLLDTSEIRNNSRYAETVKALKLIQRALSRTTHIIFPDPKQLKGQLSARLTYFDLPEIKNLLAQIATDKNIGLYSLMGSLIPPGGSGLIRTLKGHSSSVYAIAVTPDGKTVISGSADDTIKIWDLGTGTEKFTLEGHSNSVNAIAVTPDGKTVISGSRDNTIKIWDLGTGQEKFTLEGHSDWVNAIAVTPDGKTVISGSYDKTIKIWDVETGTEKFTLEGHSSSVKAIALTSDGKTVISGSSDNTIKIWDITQQKTGFFDFIHERIPSRLKFTLKGHSDSVKAIAVTPDGKTVISGSYDKTIKIWDVETGTEKFTLTAHKYSMSVDAIAVTPDGKTLISVLRHYTIDAFDASDNTIKIWDLGTGTEKFTLEGHSSSVKAIVVTPDGKTVISGSDDNTIKIWDLRTGTEKFTVKGHSDWVSAIAVTPDGKTVISGSSDNTIKIWDVVTGTEKFTFKGHSDWVSAIAVTPDGTTVISGSGDNTIKIWDLETGKAKSTLTGHSDSVNVIAVTPDGKTVISGSDDNTIKIWDLATRKEIATFTGESPIYCCAVASDGVTIVAGEQSGRLDFLRLQGKVTNE
ncbi:WD40 repeat domain-containing protein [Dolichospermum circinale]|uniref:WD40 repeat domain-containing protein n=1 Tax=Dolichospermum circinale TaxID=109265 RepID=UPI00232D0CF9|nr:hypothetical protein [Dolichospermum circinale]MDB9449523.1 hypothetical protein [Dolichospermum circinale CS-547]